MIAESFKHASNFTKFIFILFSVLIGFTLSMLIGFVVAIPLFGLNISDLSGSLDAKNIESIPALKFLQAVYSVGLFVFPPIMVAFFLNGKIGEYLKINKMPLLFSVVFVSLIMVFSLPIINFMMKLNESLSFPASLNGLENELKSLEKEAQVLSESFLEASSFSIYLANIIVMAIIPAFGEEFLFRGVFQQLFKDWTRNIHIAIWLTALLFSAMHMQFYGFIPRMVLGAFFGYLFYWSGNLWLPIIAHFVNNSIAVTAFYVNNEIAKKAETVGTNNGISPEVIISLLVVSVLIYSIIKIEKEKRIKSAHFEAENRQEYENEI